MLYGKNMIITPVDKNLILMALLSTVLLASCQDEVETETVNTDRPVTYTETKAENLSIRREFPGILAAEHKVNLSFLVPGKIIRYPIKEGQEVKKGQVISQLDNDDYTSRYDTALAEYNNLTASYERASKLRKTHYISQSDIEKIKTQKDIAAANVRLLKTALKNTQLIAPFSGVIAKNFVNNYTDIQVKQTIVSLQDNSSLKIIISVPENTTIKESQNQDSSNIKFQARFTAIPNEVFDLDIHSYETEADPVTRTYKVTLNILDTKNYQLYAGMTSKVAINIKTPSKKFYPLPISALFTRNESAIIQYVWVINEQNMVHKRRVELSYIINTHVLVISGLMENEKIVTTGVHHLRENQRVKLLSADKPLDFTSQLSPKFLSSFFMLLWR